MSNQDINKRIAEYMGLDVRLFKGEHMDKEISAYLVYEKIAGTDCPMSTLPNYCSDLNAVWHVEEKLKAEDKDGIYIFNLTVVLDISNFDYDNMYKFSHATALQRCRAIIKVLEGIDNEKE